MSTPVELDGDFLDVVFSVASQFDTDLSVLKLTEFSPYRRIVKHGNKVDLASCILFIHTKLLVVFLVDDELGDFSINLKIAIDKGTEAEILGMLDIEVVIGKVDISSGQGKLLGDFKGLWIGVELKST